MSQTTITRISHVLHRQFDELIDVSDFTKHPPGQMEGAFLSRALAALCVLNHSSADVRAAAASVTDGMDDCGIDALYFDAPTDTLLLVQSKWSSAEKSTFDEGAASKFVNGTRNLLQGNFDHFNARIRAKEPEIREILYADRDIRIRFLTVHTATQPLAPHVRRTVDNFISELNDPVPIADHKDFDQRGVYELITAESKDPKIKLQTVLNDWGVIEKPFLAYYGRVSVDQIVEWWQAHGNRLFSQNLRLFYQNSNVNDAVKRTLTEDPESFWYLNNGITIISDKVVKGIAGSPAHKFGNFTCEGASIVNGAQTVGTIGSSSDLGQSQSRSDSETWVQVRVISLEKCPPDFGRRITRAANLQNAVGNREFAAMDPLQHKLAIEFALDKRRYVYKSGEPDPRGAEGCSIVEATQALGCAHSSRLAVDVKREIGSIWADTTRAPYIDLFSEKLDAGRVWKAVSLMRAVDEIIQELRSSNAPRADMVGTHMNRIILHLVFQNAVVRGKYKDNSSLVDLKNVAKEVVPSIFESVAHYLDKWHYGEYLASFCKNHKKCESLVKSLKRAVPPDHTPEQPLLL